MTTQPSSNRPDSDQIKAQCDRILASKGFVRSQRQRAFLRFIVDAALLGQADRLKEFTLGIEVFDKDENFDPAIDSIVRVEASRLRSKLSEYYVDEGQNDVVRIKIPKGHYVPEFVLAKAPPPATEGRSNSGLWMALATAGVISAFVFVLYWLPLRQASPTTSVEARPNPASVAVLPLRDWSDSPEIYFSEAMTDALISSLAGLRPLQVTSLTSVRQYAETETPMRDIGRALRVAYIVDGSILRNDDRVQITTHLVDARSDTQIWSKSFDQSVTELAQMQDDVAIAIAAQISDELLPATERPSDGLNPIAYEAYLKGRYFYNQFTAVGFRRSIGFYQEAIQIEPGYAEAYAGLASCHCLLAGHGLEMVSPVVAIPEAHSLAMKALSLNPDLAEPQAFLGIISFKFGWDTEAAERQLERAIELNPSLFQAYVWQSQVQEATGRNAEAVVNARVAKRLNPVSLAANLNLAWQLYQAGQYIEARAEVDRLIEFNGNFWGGHWAKGHIYIKHKMYDKAVGEFKLAAELDGGHSLPLSALGYTYAVAGMTDEALAVVDSLEALSKNIYVSPFHMATIYAGLNEPDIMFEWLERAFDVRARSLAWMQVSNELAPYADDARFQDLVQRIGITTHAGAETDLQTRNLR